MLKKVKTILAVFFLISTQDGMANKQELLSSPERAKLEDLKQVFTSGSWYSAETVFEAIDKYHSYLKKEINKYMFEGWQNHNITNGLKRDLDDLERFIVTKKSEFGLAKVDRNFVQILPDKGFIEHKTIEKFVDKEKIDNNEKKKSNL